MKLSEAQKRALTHLRDKKEWVNTTPVTQKCLNALKEKGLVRVALSKDLGWCEQITKNGINVIDNI